MVSASGGRIGCCCFQPENVTLALEVTQPWTGSYSLEDKSFHLVITAERATSQALLPRRSDLTGTPGMYPWHGQEQQTPPPIPPPYLPDPHLIPVTHLIHTPRLKPTSHLLSESHLTVAERGCPAVIEQGPSAVQVKDRGLSESK